MGGIQLLIIIISFLMIKKKTFLTFIFSNFWKRKWNWIQIWMILCKKSKIDQILDLAELLNLSYSMEIIPDFRKNRIPDPDFFLSKTWPGTMGSMSQNFNSIS